MIDRYVCVPWFWIKRIVGARSEGGATFECGSSASVGINTSFSHSAKNLVLIGRCVRDNSRSGNHVVLNGPASGQHYSRRLSIAVIEKLVLSAIRQPH